MEKVIRRAKKTEDGESGNGKEVVVTLRGTLQGSLCKRILVDCIVEVVTTSVSLVLGC